MKLKSYFAKSALDYDAKRIKLKALPPKKSSTNVTFKALFASDSNLLSVDKISVAEAIVSGCMWYAGFAIVSFKHLINVVAKNFCV